MKTAPTLGLGVSRVAALATIMAILMLAVALFIIARTTITERVHVHQTDDGRMKKVPDPWRPAPGCLLVQAANGHALWPLDGRNTYNKAMADLCGSGLPVLAPGAIPNTLIPLLLPASEKWRTPLARQHDGPANTVTKDGMVIPQGAHLELSLNADLQARAQALADCMTGHAAACADAGIDDKRWNQNVEGAAMRMVGAVVVNIATGQIEAIVSAHSECYQAEYAGMPLPSHCPTPALERSKPLPGKLDHHAFAGAKPGSLVKVIMIIAFLRDPDLGPALRRMGSDARKRLLEDIQHSDSPNFLDRAYCRDLGFSNCHRLQRIADVANDLGWNTAQRNPIALTESVSDAESNPLPTARFMLDLDDKRVWRPMSLQYDIEQAKECASKGKAERWRKCRGEVANSASELYGEGNSMTSPLSVADMMAKVASAANGARTQTSPYLLHAVRGRNHRNTADLIAKTTRTPLRITQYEARFVAEGLSLTHRGGTASSACVKAHEGGSVDRAAAVRRCRQLAGVAGKTGTPSFGHEKLTWMQRTVECREVQSHIRTFAPGKAPRQLNVRRSACVQQPIKWYAGIMRKDPGSDSGPWTKAIVVLSERSWRTDGWVDSRGDHGPNVAAEFAFRLIKTMK